MWRFQMRVDSVTASAFLNTDIAASFAAVARLAVACVYFPFVHMVWGGGILQRWGGIDFAGGIVVYCWIFRLQVGCNSCAVAGGSSGAHFRRLHQPRQL